MVDGAHITAVTMKMHPSFVQASSHPCTQGFSLKKIVADTKAFSHPSHFLKEKLSGRSWLSSDRKQVSV